MGKKYDTIKSRFGEIGLKVVNDTDLLNYFIKQKIILNRSKDHFQRNAYKHTKLYCEKNCKREF